EVVADCDDNNPCTADACDAAAGCTHTAQDGLGVAGCDDGQQCNGAERCDAGVCQRTPGFGCDDGARCTHDSSTDAVGSGHVDNTGLDAIDCRIASPQATVAGAAVDALSTKMRTRVGKKIGAITKKLGVVRAAADRCPKEKRGLVVLGRQLRGFAHMVERASGHSIDGTVGASVADQARKGAAAADAARAALGC